MDECPVHRPQNKRFYPLSLLEIHTMVYVPCALLIYIYFFGGRYVIRNNSELSALMVKLQKPLDIIEPTIIHQSQLEECPGTIALMLMGKQFRPIEGGEPLLSEGCHVCIYNQIGTISTNNPGLDSAAPFETIS